MTTQEALSEALWSLHEAAMDAANDPNPDTLREVRKAYDKVAKLRSRFLFEQTQRHMEALPR